MNALNVTPKDKLREVFGRTDSSLHNGGFTSGTLTFSNVVNNFKHDPVIQRMWGSNLQQSLASLATQEVSRYVVPPSRVHASTHDRGMITEPALGLHELNFSSAILGQTLSSVENRAYSNLNSTYWQDRYPSHQLHENLRDTYRTPTPPPPSHVTEEPTPPRSGGLRGFLERAGERFVDRMAETGENLRGRG